MCLVRTLRDHNTGLIVDIKYLNRCYNSRMISKEAILTILGIKENVDLRLDEMVTRLKVTFYPSVTTKSEVVRKFYVDFKKSLDELNVKVLPFNEVWERVPFTRRVVRFLKYFFSNIEWLRRRILNLPPVNFYLPLRTLLRLSSKWRIKKGISIVCVGEQEVNELVMQYITNFKTNSIITIVDLPDHVKADSDFSVHFNTSMSLFAYHMTNIIIAVNESRWITYNFNASHPSFIYPDENMSDHILSSIVPKISAPISPHKLSEFKILGSRFDPCNMFNKKAVSDMVEGARLFSLTKLFPNGKSIDSLPFRNNLHRLIGKLHLDNRSGMSFGYLAFQLPTKLPVTKTLSEFKKELPEAFIDNKDYFISDKGQIFITSTVADKKIVIQIPDVWVITIRSGANKTNFDIEKDLIKIGLINGQMYMQLPKGLIQDNTYKPSFDTKVILAHAVCNALIAIKAKIIGNNIQFSKMIQKRGISISHWH